MRKTGTVPRRSFLGRPWHVRRKRSVGLSPFGIAQHSSRFPGSGPPWRTWRPWRFTLRLRRNRPSNQDSDLQSNREGCGRDNPESTRESNLDGDSGRDWLCKRPGNQQGDGARDPDDDAESNRGRKLQGNREDDVGSDGEGD